MNIKVIRQACCAQDDQLGPLCIDINLDKDATIQDLAKAIGKARFLQFSGTHNLINAWSDGIKLFAVPSLSNKDNSVEYFINKTGRASEYIKNNEVECLWPQNL